MDFENRTEHYLPSTEGVTLRLVDKVCLDQNLEGVTITFDNLYTSVPLAKKLLERSISCIGTLRSNRVGIPKEVKEVNGRERYSTETWWESTDEYMTITSYITKTSKGMKNILILATVPPFLGIERQTGRSVPGIIERYNFTKGKYEI